MYLFLLLYILIIFQLSVFIMVILFSFSYYKCAMTSNSFFTNPFIYIFPLSFVPFTIIIITILDYNFSYILIFFFVLCRWHAISSFIIYYYFIACQHKSMFDILWYIHLSSWDNCLPGEPFRASVCDPPWSFSEDL